ncbi:GyrI-like domain-containing protein [Aliikangiella sp. G2MR2-5]|uniref:AraC family transcriptional regulator n=1 Tax=Aliikangiella sp. G2MR2-5 TaxID=2788943 RepID=UPI0018AAF1F9|nr:GyrI-like domain-containing protein [Aliikangiella sp. G2MR2-5]
MKSIRYRISEVVTYIEILLEKQFILEEPIEKNELELKSLASIACLSSYHFQRCFTSLLELSPFEFIQLLRFKWSASKLLYRSEISITDIAFLCGFESAEGFSRAFKKKFMQSPRTFRQSPDLNSWEILNQTINRIRSKLMNQNSDILDNCLDKRPTVEVVMIEKVRVGVLKHEGSPAQIPLTLRKFIQWRKENKLSPKISRTFNLMYSDPRTTADSEFRMDLCAQIKSELKENLQGIVESTIPSMRCARVDFRGRDSDMASVIDYLYRDWLDTVDELPGEYPLIIERVSFYPDVAEKDAFSKIYLPLK